MSYPQLKFRGQPSGMIFPNKMKALSRLSPLTCIQLVICHNHLQSP